MPRANHKIDSDLSNVAKLAADLHESCVALGIAHSSATILEICIVEAVNNAIEHAYGGRPGNKVEVSLDLCGASLVTEISDTGKAMRPEQLGKASLTIPDLDHLDSLAERGMGLGIIKDAMDEVAYATSHGVNRLILSTRVELAGASRAVEGSR